jgi:DNA-binding GntR family transcriptional regulator
MPRLPSQACDVNHPICVRSLRPGVPSTRSSSRSTDNEILSDIHRRLGVDAIWIRALRHQDAPRYLDPGYLVALVEALEAGDVERSCDLVVNHAMEARHVARRAIEAAGGNV